MERKNILKSKTFWMNIFMAVMPFFSTDVQSHVPEFSALWAVLAIVLRMVTKEKVVLLG